MLVKACSEFKILCSNLRHSLTALQLLSERCWCVYVLYVFMFFKAVAMAHTVRKAFTSPQKFENHESDSMKRVGIGIFFFCVALT